MAGPCAAGPTGWPGPPGSTSGDGTRGAWPACGCWAGTCASLMASSAVRPRAAASASSERSGRQAAASTTRRTGRPAVGRPGLAGNTARVGSGAGQTAVTAPVLGRRRRCYGSATPGIGPCGTAVALPWALRQRRIGSGRFPQVWTGLWTTEPGEAVGLVTDAEHLWNACADGPARPGLRRGAGRPGSRRSARRARRRHASCWPCRTPLVKERIEGRYLRRSCATRSADVGRPDVRARPRGADRSPAADADARPEPAAARPRRRRRRRRHPPAATGRRLDGRPRRAARPTSRR